mmetsp:Transcript_3780/g.9445  ORF Transcript_3780/g.9445 Transcript_3780/m.9445 type:complete len:265 (+) Transcript_3780:678-1472(+)
MCVSGVSRLSGSRPLPGCPCGGAVANEREGAPCAVDPHGRGSRRDKRGQVYGEAGGRPRVGQPPDREPAARLPPLANDVIRPARGVLAAGARGAQDRLPSLAVQDSGGAQWEPGRGPLAAKRRHEHRRELCQRQGPRRARRGVGQRRQPARHPLHQLWAASSGHLPCGGLPPRPGHPARRGGGHLHADDGGDGVHLPGHRLGRLRGGGHRRLVCGGAGGVAAQGGGRIGHVHPGCHLARRQGAAAVPQARQAVARAWHDRAAGG